MHGFAWDSPVCLLLKQQQAKILIWPNATMIYVANGCFLHKTFVRTFVQRRGYFLLDSVGTLSEAKFYL
jgi:hypothetical protein